MDFINWTETGLKHILYLIQATIVIHSFAIRGYDHLGTRKQGKTTNNKRKT